MTDNRGMLWTREENNQLVNEINGGMSLEEMVEAHGRTPYAIIGKLQALGLIVLRESGYHLVNPDPWALTSGIREAQYEFYRGKK